MCAHEYHQERLQVERLTERAILVACHLPDSKYDERDPLGELRDLARTAGAEIVGEMIQKRTRPDAGTYLGSGKLDELRALKGELKATLVIFDNDLSPAQIRNIEKVVDCKIIDRSELILDIFAGRATTSAAKLQVELAQLEYTYPRLRAMWTHFGQIAGGAPVGIGTRGPGETQIETDRRLVQRRKTVLRKRLEEIQERRVREVAQRAQENFTVCLVGYTNAGKSTLFNALTKPSGGGGAYADDRLFATLTTRTRRWPLDDPSMKGRAGGDEAMLSDTVGFVRDLPHHLVASFRATLEEAVHADVLLIVIDVSDPQAHFHFDVVNRTLDEIERDYEHQVRKTGRGPIERKVQFPTDEAYGSDSKGHPSGRSDDDPATSDGDTDDSGFDHLGVEDEAESSSIRHPVRLVVLNKIDAIDDHSELAVWHSKMRDAVPVSAVTGDGTDELADRVHQLYHGGIDEYRVTMPYSSAKELTYAEQRGEVLSRDYDEKNVHLRIRFGALHADRLRSMGVSVIPIEPDS